MTQLEQLFWDVTGEGKSGCYALELASHTCPKDYGMKNIPSCKQSPNIHPKPCVECWQQNHRKNKTHWGKKKK